MAARHRALLVAACVATLAACGGCELFAPATPRADGLPHYLRRMQASYPDLAAGRFVCLAHFEAPNQAPLFRVTDATGDEGNFPQPEISVLRSRDAAGSGSLRALLTPATELRFDGARSTELALIRDWRGYPLLLFSLYGPPEGAQVRFAVHSGTTVPLEWTRTLDVGPGWNLYRIDVAELGDTVDLADVRCLSWRMLAPSAPLELFVDDVILADNTRTVHGESAGPGELYVFEQGRRVHVGVRERFELAFADGLIVAWHAETPVTTAHAPPHPTSIELERDTAPAPTAPDRSNLTVRSGLGPLPLALPAEWYAPGAPAIVYDDPAMFAAWGPAVTTQQWLREATAARVVVQGQWSFGQPGTAGTTPPAPAHTWQYVIYPTGEVFVTVASTAPAGGWGAPRVAYATALVGRRGFEVQPLPAPTGAPLGALAARPGPAADLLWVPHDPALATHAHELVSADERRIAVLLGDCDAAALVETAHLLRLWPHDIDGPPEAYTFAADYQAPATVALTVGRLVTDTPGDLNRDGYNESEGCYELAPDSDVLRFRFDPGETLRHAPRFRIHDSAERRCWVYVDGRRVPESGRDRHDRCLVVLPTTVTRPADVEVHTRGQP